MLDLSSVHDHVGPINHDGMAHVCATCMHMGQIILRIPNAIVRTGIAIVIAHNGEGGFRMLYPG